MVCTVKKNTSLSKDKKQCSDSEFDPTDECDGELTQEDALVNYPPQPHEVFFLCPIIAIFVATAMCCIPIPQNTSPCHLLNLVRFFFLFIS